MKKTLLFLAACAVVPCFALSVAEGGKSSYQIVVPDGTGNKALDGFVELGGKVIRTAIRKASGAELPLLKESKMIPGKPAIFVGGTRALKAAGLSTKDFAPWEHGIRVKGKDIFVYGKDLPNPFKKVKYPGYFIYYVNGSLKAACTFVELFANTRFVGKWFNAYGEHDGVRTLPQREIQVPDDFNYRRNPRFRNRVGDGGGVLYCVANNFLFDVGADYHVHYHAFAIPQAKFYKAHPEYFALIDGKRYFHDYDGGSRPQYCLTNPEVQKLIYEEALARADNGMKVVELGQSDGFKWCECARCKAWYNTSDWREKLWLFHRDLAERLQKDRPGVTVAIAAYEPTHQAPRSFRKFPGKGVIIDLAPATPELLRDFENYNVLGFAAWTYYFGCYRANGFSPARPLSLLKREAGWLHKSRISSFYHCGMGTAPSLTGPWEYIWGKLHENPGLDVNKELREYCLFAFGPEAAPHFFNFFSLLDKRMEKHKLVFLKIEGRYDPAQGDDFTGPQTQAAVDLWNLRYPPEVMKQLDKFFSAGVKAAGKGNYMVECLKTEYEYMRLTAAVCHAVAAMEKDNTFSNRCRLADAIEARGKFIDALPRRKKEPHRIDGQAFYGSNVNTLREGGGMTGRFRGAFHSDPDSLRKKMKSIELVKVKDFADPSWAKIAPQSLFPLKKEFPAAEASFKVAYTDKALLFKFTAPMKEAPAENKLSRDGMKLWRNSVWEIFLTTGRDIRQLVFSAVPDSCYDSIIYPKKYKRTVTAWNPRWQHRDKIAGGVWSSEVTIPFSAFGEAPRNGEARQMQVGFSTPGARCIYAWNISLTSQFADISGFGKIRFGRRAPERERVLEKITPFTPGPQPSSFRNWITSPENLPLTGESGSLKLEAQVKNYLGIYNRNYIPLEEDETVQITLKTRGRGKAWVGLGWFDNGGNWVANSSSKPFTLGTKSQSHVFEFKVGEFVSRGAARFQLVIFLQKPGGVLILDKAEMKIKRPAI